MPSVRAFSLRGGKRLPGRPAVPVAKWRPADAKAARRRFAGGAGQGWGGVRAVRGTQPADRGGHGGGEARGVDGGYLGAWSMAQQLLHALRADPGTKPGGRKSAGGRPSGRTLGQDFLGKGGKR